MKLNPFKARFPQSDSREQWCNLTGSSVAIALLQAARHHNGLTLVVTRSSHQAQVLEQDLNLLNTSEQLPILHFPDHETLPYDLFSPHPDIISDRLKTLAELPAMERGIVVVSMNTLMQGLPPTDFILGRSLHLKAGQELVIDDFRKRLERAGYQATDQVYQAGEFAVRGSVIDLFPAGSSQPFRLDLFDEELESIRSFDPETQRSQDSINEIRLLPAREYPFDEDSIKNFRKAFRNRFDVDIRKVNLYQELREGIHPQGLEQYLPLFFQDQEATDSRESLTNLLDYISAEPYVVVQEGALEAATEFWQQVQDRWEQRRHDLERPILNPEELYVSDKTLIGHIKSAPGLQWKDSGRGVQFDTQQAPDLHLHDKAKEPAQDLKDYLENYPGRVLFAADTAGRREVLQETLKTFDIAVKYYDSFAQFYGEGNPLGLCVLPIDQGCVIADHLTILTEAQIFGGRSRPKTSRAAGERDPEAIIRNLSDLAIGAPVVHEDHGVGRYQGLQNLDIDGRPAEFLTLEYADGDRLYVPVSSLHLVSRYTGSSAESAPLHRLGSDRWAKTKRKAAEKIRDVAAELLDLYARRNARSGHRFSFDPRFYAEFASTFPFEETQDQQTAIDAVLSDMCSERPMDRVVCGDVGFGKTEVALRAAFAAVQGGKQVAVLVPTTLLAQQHFTNFRDRFADWPVRVEVLSRFRTGKQTEQVLEAIENGQADIIVGTHRLIQKDIKFKHLGLVVIDEEQRFGVRQKERLKQLRAQVDVLTLTATPIPRTLNMSMAGIRDLSIIATPPARRMAVKTIVAEWDKSLLREAIHREIQRGGQVYFLHNEVRTIDRIARELEELVPNIRLRIAHGQMHERELEQVMLDFYRQRINVLLCTTIIENGIDVSSANTIIINRADRFGLAQLHQLRGRVGRSHHRAYAYLLVPDRRSITADARKRLDAIASLEELGAGFTLATHDLEIRGAGELLGDEQSGQIHEIGFSLYSEMLARAVAALKRGDEPALDQPLHQGIEVELHLPALIPDDYLPDVHARLTLYKRIASASSEQELRDLQVEMIDRFGLLPQAIKNLFSLAVLRLTATELGIQRIDLGPLGGRLEFTESTQADPAALIQLIQTQPQNYRLDGPQKLKILIKEGDGQKRIHLIEQLLYKLITRPLR